MPKPISVYNGQNIIPIASLAKNFLKQDKIGCG